MGLLRAALAIAIVSLLTSCAAVTPAFVSPSAVTAISQASSASSYYSFMPFFSSFGSAPRWPGDEVRIDAVPVPSAPDHRQYSGVAALESLTHYWGDPADWRGIAAEIAPLEGGDAAITRILACLNRRDYEARLRQATLDSVRDEVRRGRPVLLFLKSSRPSPGISSRSLRCSVMPCSAGCREFTTSCSWWATTGTTNTSSVIRETTRIRSGGTTNWINAGLGRCTRRFS